MPQSKAILYMRLSSTDGQNELESESITNQRQLLYTFVDERDDITIVGEEIDDGFTGTNFNRPGFQSAIRTALLGNADCIIVKDLSRLGRDYIETGFYLRNFFPQYQIRFISVNDGIDTHIENDLGSQIDVTLKTILNDCYSADISKKTRVSLATKRKNGQFIGSTTIYGYKKSTDDAHTLHIDPYPSEVVNIIFSLYQNGSNAKTIAEQLNTWCVASPLAYKKEQHIAYPSQCFGANSDCAWSPTTIRRILTDETYTGTLLQGKQTTYSNKLKKVLYKERSEWAITPHAHAPIITQESFDFTQKLLQLETRTPPKKQKLHLFSGLVYCGDCNKQMTRKTVPYRNQKYVYYSCSTGKKMGCNTKMIRETELMQCIQTILEMYQKLNWIAPLSPTYVPSQLYYDGTIAHIDTELKLKNTYLSSLDQAHVDGFISYEEHAIYRADYMQKIHNLTIAKEKLSKNSIKKSELLERKHIVQNLTRITLNGNRMILSFYAL